MRKRNPDRMDRVTWFDGTHKQSRDFFSTRAAVLFMNYLVLDRGYTQVKRRPVYRGLVKVEKKDE